MKQGGPSNKEKSINRRYQWNKTIFFSKMAIYHSIRTS